MCMIDVSPLAITFGADFLDILYACIRLLMAGISVKAVVARLGPFAEISRNTAASPQ